MMYVPLHCAIATTVYLQCQQSDRPPPNTLTGLYTCLARIILEQYLQEHPDYKENEYELNSFSDLPSFVYAHFQRLCSLAFDGVDKQQLIFRSLPQKFEHLGFMDAVPERLMLSQQFTNYSYNFLHLSVQEYLAAHHVSLMSHHEQEQILKTVRYGDHCFNMVRFLAGITQFKHLNKELVEKVIGIKRYGEAEANISEYALEILYECQDMNILSSKCSYHINIQSTDSVHSLTALGYCIVESTSKWHVTFSGRDNSGIEVLKHTLMENPHPTYHIESIECEACTPDFTEQVLLCLPNYALKEIKNISLQHHDAQPLPPCLPKLILTTEKLNTLKLKNVLNTSLTKLIPVLSRVSTLRNLSISNSNHMKFDISTCTINIKDCTSEFLDQLLPALPQHCLAHATSLTIDFEREYEYDTMLDYRQQIQLLPSCLPELILIMEKLSTLKLKDVHNASLTKLIPVLSRVSTLRNLSISNSNHMKFDISTCTINIKDCTSEFLDQLLPALPQHCLAHATSLTIDFKSEYEYDTMWDYHQQIQSLSSCLLRLIPRIERLTTLTVKNVHETSLTRLIPALSRVPYTLRNLLISDSSGENKFEMQFPIEDPSTASIESINISSEFLDQILPALPHQSISHIKSLTINHYKRSYASGIECRTEPLPSCLLKLVPSMENLHLLTLTTLLDATLIALMPVLSTVSITRKFTLNIMLRTSEEEEIFTYVTLVNEGTPIEQLLLQKRHMGQIQPSENQLFDIVYDVCSTQCKCTCSSSETIEQLLKFLPQQHMAQIQAFQLSYSRLKPLPSCLSELILRMERLTTLSMSNVLDTSLIELIPVLATVPTLKNLTLSNAAHQPLALFQSDSMRVIMTMIFCNCSIEAIKCQNCKTEFIFQILRQLPQQFTTQVKKMIVCNKIPQLLPCFIELIPRMESLSTLVLKTVVDTSLTEVIPELSRVPNLRNLKLQTSTDNFQMSFPTDSLLSIGTINSTSIFFVQFLPQIPQQIVTHIGNLTIKQLRGGPKQLPQDMLNLIPKMKNLMSLTIETVIDATLIAVIKMLSIVPVENKLTLNITLGAAMVKEKFNYDQLEKECTCTCTSPEIIEQLLQVLPQQHLAQIQTFIVSYCTAKPLPPCLVELIPRMEKLNILILKNVLETSMTELLPALFRITTLRDLILHKLNCNVTIKFYSNFIEAIECEYSVTEFIHQILIQIPQKFVSQVKTLTMRNTKEDKDEDEYWFENDYYYDDYDDDYENEDDHSYSLPLPMPPCLPELIPKMGRLNTLTLENILDSSLTELIPTLSGIPTLRNLTLQELNSKGIALLCQWLPTCQLEKLIICMASRVTITFSNHFIETIECQYYTTEPINEILQQIPQQLIAQVKRFSIFIDDKYEDENFYEQPHAPPCLPALIARMEKLNMLTLENVLIVVSLTKQVVALPTLRSLTLHELNPKGIALLCWWLPTCQLETLKLPDLSPDEIETVSRALTATLSLKTLNMQKSFFTLQSMQAFASMLRQNLSLTEVNTSCCNIDSDSACCLAEALHHNITLRMLDVSGNPVGERGSLAIAKMLKHNTILEQLNLSDAKISSTGIVAIAEAFHHGTTLRKLDMSRNPKGECMGAFFIKLDTKTTPAGERGALAMAKMLKYNTILIELNLSSADISSGGAVAMAEALHHNTTLRKLDMSKNPIGQYIARTSIKDILDSNLKATRESTLAEERGALAMADMLKHNTTLLDLNLSCANISSDGVAAITEALHYNTTLTKLDMSSSQLREEEALAIAIMLRKNNVLEELNLKDEYIVGRIGNKGINALVESLAVNKYLKKLVVSDSYESFATSLLSLYSVHRERVLFES